MHLQAGEWSLEFRDGDLWHIRAGGREAVERVYFALRDEGWGTVPFRISGLQTEVSDGAFRIAFEAEHRRGSLDFAWKGLITGSADGVLRYEVSGESRGTFQKNRIGLCVHHPGIFAGTPVVAIHSDGRTSRASFPTLISPHQPVLDIRALRYAFSPACEVEIRFGGEVWEMEDQRNWSDANFKTYPTPLSLPFPVEIRPGWRLEQSVEIRLRHSGFSRPVPVGLTLDAPPEARLVERLHRMKVSYLRLEDPSRSAEAARWNLPIELALELKDDAGEFPAAMDFSQAPLLRVIVYRSNQPVAGARVLEKVRARFPGIPVLPGVNGHFAELNRNRTSDFSQGVAFGICPQVHAFDTESIMANLASFDALAATVRSFAGQAPIRVSPLRFAPQGVDDPRLLTGTGAAWLRGALAHSARLGFESVTFDSLGTVMRSALLETLLQGDWQDDA